MNFPEVFQIKQAFSVFKCDMGGNLEPKRSHPHVCGKCPSKEVDGINGSRSMRFDFSTDGVCPPPKSMGFFGDLSCLSGMHQR